MTQETNVLLCGPTFVSELMAQSVAGDYQIRIYCKKVVCCFIPEENEVGHDFLEVNVCDAGCKQIF